jgi:hypothetical protein
MKVTPNVLGVPPMPACVRLCNFRDFRLSDLPGRVIGGLSEVSFDVPLLSSLMQFQMRRWENIGNHKHYIIPENDLMMYYGWQGIFIFVVFSVLR